MYQKIRMTLGLLMLMALTTSIDAEQVGRIAVPIFKDVQVQTHAAYDSATGLYTYSYTITNPATNTGEIWSIDIDITKPPNSVSISSYGLTIPFGVRIRTFDDVLTVFEGDNVPMIPVGMRLPVGWVGSLGASGVAGFDSGDTPNILPGETRGGFDLISYGLPTIRQIELEPWWIYVEDEDPTEEEDQRARKIEESLPFKTKTLGPSAVSPGSYEYWNQLRDDLNQAIQLGWIPDTTLANTLVAQLSSARQTLDTNDGTLAKSRLQILLNTLTQSTQAQRRQEAYDLTFLNVQKLIERTPDTPVPYEPKGKLSPQSLTLPIGSPYALTATLINLGDNKPIEGLPLLFRVRDGPHSGLEFRGIQ
jgi:hypothetical protein